MAAERGHCEARLFAVRGALRASRRATRFRALAEGFPTGAPPGCAPVAQLDRASDYESEGRTFESFRARQFSHKNHRTRSPLLGPPNLEVALGWGLGWGLGGNSRRTPPFSRCVWQTHDPLRRQVASPDRPNVRA